MKYHTTTLYWLLVFSVSFSISLYDFRREPMFLSPVPFYWWYVSRLIMVSRRCYNGGNPTSWSSSSICTKRGMARTQASIPYRGDRVWKHILSSVGCPCFLLSFNNCIPVWPRYTISFSLVWNGTLRIWIRWRVFLLRFRGRKMEEVGSGRMH